MAMPEPPKRPEPLAPQPPEDAAAQARREMVEHPAKLLRIGGMIRETLEEVRRAPLDQDGRRRAREIHERSIQELKDAVSADLREELDKLVFPFAGDVPSQSELRVSQAQLVGWFEGLFHGMQAILFGQQRPQPPFPPMMPPMPGQQGPQQPERPGPGQYL